MWEALKSPCSQNWGYREKYSASSASQTSVPAARVLWLFWVFRSEDKRQCWCDAWLPLHNSSRPEPELLDYLDQLAPNRIFRISLCLLLRTQFALDRPALCVHPSPQQLTQKIPQFSSNVIIVHAMVLSGHPLGVLGLHQQRPSADQSSSNGPQFCSFDNRNMHIAFN